MEKRRQQTLLEREERRETQFNLLKQNEELSVQAKAEMLRKKRKKKMNELAVNQQRLQYFRNVLKKLFNAWKSYARSVATQGLVTMISRNYAFQFWKKLYFARVKAHNAAKSIQNMFRMHQRNHRLKITAFEKQKLNENIDQWKIAIGKRCLHKALNVWSLFVKRAKSYKSISTILQRNHLSHTCIKWHHWSVCRVSVKDRCSRQIQRTYRIFKLYEGMKTYRKESKAATVITKAYRGFHSRKITQTLRELRDYQISQCQILEANIQKRVLKPSYGQWKKYTLVMHNLKFATRNRRIGRLQVGVMSLLEHKNLQIFLRKMKQQRLHTAASMIQHCWSRKKFRGIIRSMVLQTNAAISIQKVVRGFLARMQFQKYQSEVAASSRIQSIWRYRMAKNVLEARRNQIIARSVYSGDYTTTKYWLHKGYGLNPIDSNGNSILHVAAAGGHKRLVKLALRNGVNIVNSNNCGQSSLHLLILNLPQTTSQHNTTECMKILYDKSDPPRVKREDYVALVSYLIDQGVSLDAADFEGMTPLLLAASLGHTDIVQILLQYDTEPRVRCFNTSLSPTQYALEGNHAATLSLLFKTGWFDSGEHGQDTLSLLHRGAELGFEESICVIISHILQKHTAFSYLCQEMQASPLAFLNSMDYYGKTPLIYAITQGYLGVVRLLLENGALPDTKDRYYGQSPLHYAVLLEKNTCKDIVKLLLDYEANVECTDNSGDALLHISSAADVKFEITTYLLRQGAIPNRPNKTGDSPVQIAARYGALKTLTLLIEYGADLNRRNYEGKTTLGVARIWSQKLIVDYILNHFSYEEFTTTGTAYSGNCSATLIQGSRRTITEKDCSTTSSVTQGQFKENPDGLEMLNESITVHRNLTPQCKEDNEEMDNEQNCGATNWTELCLCGYKMGTIADWTHYVDAKSSRSFFVCNDFSESQVRTCTWHTPVEFSVALGTDWIVVKRGSNNSQKLIDLNKQNTLPEGNNEKSSELVNLPPQQRYTNINDSDNGLSDISKEVGYYYYNKQTKKYQIHAPAITDFALFEETIQKLNRRKYLRARLKYGKSTRDLVSGISAIEYLRFHKSMDKGIALERSQGQAAIKIQRCIRMYRIQKCVRTIIKRHHAAIYLQCRSRGYLGRKVIQKMKNQILSATKIQAQARGYLCRQNESRKMHAQRINYRAQRAAAIQIQCLYRGYISRKSLYRAKIIMQGNPRDYFSWEKVRKRAHVLRSFKVWDEMHDPVEFPWLMFYAHRITRVCSWEKPKLWEDADRQAKLERIHLAKYGYSFKTLEKAIYIQRQWRARSARLAFQRIKKAIQIMNNSEREYVEDPSNLVKLCNYVLFLHVIHHEYDRVRPLYGRLMRIMAQRGPDIPLVLFSYAIFLYVTQEEDTALIYDMIRRGKIKDPHIETFNLAFIGFFKQSQLHNPLNSESNLNYAACLQLLYNKFDEATPFYLQGIAFATGHTNKSRAMSIFQIMLNQKKRLDKANHLYGKHSNATKITQDNDQEYIQYNGSELFRQWQILQAVKDENERQKLVQESLLQEKHIEAAKKIQARFRRRLAIRLVNQFKMQQYIEQNTVELSRQKSIYNEVSQAFKHITHELHNDMTNIVPIHQFPQVLQNLSYPLTRNDIQDITMEFNLLYPSMKTINLLDISNFAIHCEKIRQYLK